MAEVLLQPVELHRTRSWREALSSHAPELILLLILLGAFVIRIIPARDQVLRIDETQHLILADQASLSDVYRVGLGQAHPPLLYFVLYYWRFLGPFLGSSVLILRLPIVLLGTAAIAATYAWVRYVSGTLAALASATLEAFLPPFVILSFEVRHYALLLLFMPLALLWLERSLDRQSSRGIAVFAVWLYLALCSDYSALWFALTLGPYALWRIWRERARASVRNAWIISQLGFVALFSFFYRTHISKLRHSVLRQVAEYWNFQSYRPGEDRLQFIGSHTLRMFRYLFGHTNLAVIGLALFVAGSVLAKRVRNGSGERRGLLLLVLVPFAIAWPAAFAHFLPFGSTRHSIFIGQFVLFAVALALGAAAGLVSTRWPIRMRHNVGLAATVILSAIICYPALRQVWQYQIDQPWERNADFERAVEYLRAEVPKGTLIFTDRAYSQRLAFYLDRTSPFQGEPFSFEILATNRTPHPEWEFQELDRVGYRIVSWREMIFVEDYVMDEVNHFARAYPFAGSHPPWMLGSAARVGFCGYQALRFYLDGDYPQQAVWTVIGPYYIVRMPAGLFARGRTARP